MMQHLKRLLVISILAFSHIILAHSSDSVRVIVKYKEPKTAMMPLKAQLALAAQLPIRALQPIAGGAYVLTFDSASLRGISTQTTDTTTLILERLRQNPNVVYAVKDRKGYFKPLPTPNLNEESPYLSHALQWDEFTRPGGIMLESAPGLRDGAWAYTSGIATPPIVVAVLDTGIASHDSLINNLIKDTNNKIWGWNFAANNHDLSDETKSYHGTHVAGTIAGYGDIITGMGEHLKILPLNIPDESGMFYKSAVINAIHWAVGDHVPGVPDNPYPAKVLNMSFGVDERPGKEIDHCDEALQEAIFYARKQGSVIVAAAGNDNRWEHYNAPAVCNGVIKVASTGPAGLRAYYSNYGPGVMFAAPGGDMRKYGIEGGILSTVNPHEGYQQSGFSFYQGTSMASPHAAGVAGLIFAATEQSISPQKVEQILYTTTHHFGKSDNPNLSCVGKKPCGHGILDAENAVKAAIGGFDVIFSAPSVEQDTSTQAHWIPIHSTKQLVSQPFQPHVYLGNDNKIYAQSGVNHYQLADTAYQRCQIIGYDGIGCYR